MAIDRAKLTKSAQKHLAKGNLDRAIADYEKLVEDDPKDARTLLKLGDLYTKKGALRSASDTYRKVAAQYAEQGFFLKAVAVFKQILKLDPSQLDIWEKLAEMYELLSLTNDAVATFEQVADAYQRAGKAYKALGPLGKIEKLDPNNVAASIRYAEALSKARRVDEAVEAFQRGAAVLKRQGRLDDYIKVSERLLYHQPENMDVGRELADLYLRRNEPKSALAKLQQCFKSDPKDPMTLNLLARAFEALGQTAKTVSVYHELARIHGEAGQVEAQAEAYRKALQVDPGDDEARRALRSLGGQVDVREPPVTTIEMEEDEDDEDLIILDDEDDSGVVSLSDSGARSIPTEEEHKDVAAQVSRLMTEYEVFVRYGLHEKVEAQLKTVLALLPSHLEARVKLAEHYAGQDQGPEAAEQLLIAAEGVRGQDVELAMEYCTLAIQHDPRNDAAKQLLQRIAGDDEPAAPTPKTHEAEEDDLFEAAADDDLIILDDVDEDGYVAADAMPEEASGVVFDGDTDTERDAAGEDPFPLGTNRAPNPPALPTRAAGESLPARSAGAWPLQSSGPAQRHDTPVPPDRPAPTRSPQGVPGSATPWPPLGSPSPATESFGIDVQRRPAASAFSAPGALDLPHASARGGHPVGSDEAQPPFRPQQASIPMAEHEAPTAQAPRPKSAHPHETEEDLPEELVEALEEIEFYAAQGMLDTARDTLADALRSYPGHAALLAKERMLIPPEASSRPPSMRPARSSHPPSTRTASRPPSILPPGDYDDQSFALAEKLAEESPAETSSAGSEAIDVNDVIDQFRAGVRKAVDKGDTATHYDLGIAYMEMGLHSEAIEEFVLCLDSPQRRCQALTMIGLSYVAKGDMTPGIEHFEEALKSEPSEGEQLDLWFEIGNAYELSGRNNDALIFYEKVEEVDAGYREVAQRIARLGMPASPEQEEDEFDTMFDNMILKD